MLGADENVRTSWYERLLSNCSDEGETIIALAIPIGRDGTLSRVPRRRPSGTARCPGDPGRKLYFQPVCEIGELTILCTERCLDF
jgi:hypothetical protein